MNTEPFEIHHNYGVRVGDTTVTPNKVELGYMAEEMGKLIQRMGIDEARQVLAQVTNQDSKDRCARVRLALMSLERETGVRIFTEDGAAIMLSHGDFDMVWKETD